MKSIKSRQIAVLATIFVLCSAFQARAQFYTSGTDAASVSWSFMETPTYKVIYPRGLDSLAKAYAVSLESFADPVGQGIGVRPNASYKRRMPVILHTQTAYSNGLVTWTPRRMELYTTPDPFAPEATPWISQLAVHESRHVAQMQPGAAAPFRFGNILTGQLISGAMAAIYCGPSFLEGDAVVAETALSNAGRGRTADFLEYYRSSLAYGQTRDYWQWRWGSQRFYTPNHYTIGYVSIGGARAYFDAPDFTARYFQRIKDHHGIAFNNFQKTIQEVSGMKFKDAFKHIEARMQHEWEQDDALRGPFMPSEQVSPTPRRFTEYGALESIAGDEFYAVGNSLSDNETLFLIRGDGSSRRIRLFGHSHSRPQLSKVTGNLYWSEIVRDARWTQRSYSIIRSMGQNGSVRTLAKGRKYFHPSPSPCDSLLAVTEYPEEGGSRIAILDTKDGSPVRSYSLPANLQAVECVWIGNSVYVSAISDAGFGIYSAEGRQILAPQPVKIKQLWEHGGRIMFTSDRTGVNELYALDTSDGSLEQMTNTRLGAADFQFDGKADMLYYSTLLPEGRLIFKTATADLPRRKVDFSQIHRYQIAEALSEGETSKVADKPDAAVSEPRNYSKAANLFKFHSWAPLYVDYDEVDKISYSSLSTLADLGATAFFQNELGTSYGSIAYHADLFGGKPRHSLHASVTYSGLYPVIKAKLDFNDRNAVRSVFAENNTAEGLGRPLMRGSVNAYIPWSNSIGGIDSGFIPSVTYAFSNDRFLHEGKSGMMQRLTASARAYAVQPIADSRIFPKFGVGVESGISGRPGMTNIICPNFYASAYAYLPGLHRTHGLKLSAIHQQVLSMGLYSEVFASTAPRGFNSETNKLLSSIQKQTKIGVDYAIPFAPVDWTWLCPSAYIRNFELIPHFDLTILTVQTRSSSLYSAGADIRVRLGNFFWLPYDTRIGVRLDYNDGPFFESLSKAGISQGKFTAGLSFSIDL